MGISRIAVLGHGGVGKTCLITQYIKGHFSGTHNPTLEDSYRHLIPLPDGSSQIVEIIDTAGTLQFPAMRRLSIESAQCFIVVYAKDCEESLNAAREILDEIYEIKNGTAPVMLVANKSDVGSESMSDENSDYEEDTQVVTSSPLTPIMRALSQVKRQGRAKRIRRISVTDSGNSENNKRSESPVNGKYSDVSQNISPRRKFTLKIRKNGTQTKSPLIETKSDPTCSRVSVMRSQSACGKRPVTVMRSDSCGSDKSTAVTRSQSACHTRPAVVSRSGAKSTPVTRSTSACHTKPLVIQRSDLEASNNSAVITRSLSACHTRPVLVERSDSNDSGKEDGVKRSDSAYLDDLFTSYNCHKQCSHKETSAKFNKNVDSVFRELAAKMYFLNQVDDSRGWSKRLSMSHSRSMGRSVSASNFNAIQITEMIQTRRATTNVPPLKLESKRIIRDIMRNNNEIEKKMCCVM